MANKVLLKKSSVAARVPTTVDLDYGELALNYQDGKLYYKDASNNIKYFLEGGSNSTTALAASNLTITTNNFTGDGSTVNFTLSASPSSDNYILVAINGVTQDVAAYSISGAVLTLSVAPSSGDTIETRVLSGLASEITLKNYSKYIYNINSTISTITGVDSYSNTLAYDSGAVDVYHNGIRLVETEDYTASNGTSVVLNAAAVNGDVVEVLSYGKAYIVDSWNPVSASLTTTTADQVIDTFAIGSYSSAKYLVQAKTSSAIHLFELNVMHNGTNAYITELSSMASGSSLGSFGVDINAGVLRLLFTPANINTTVKARRVVINA